MQKKRKFNRECKLEAVRLVKERGVSVALLLAPEAEGDHVARRLAPPEGRDLGQPDRWALPGGQGVLEAQGNLAVGARPLQVAQVPVDAGEAVVEVGVLRQDLDRARQEGQGLRPALQARFAEGEVAEQAWVVRPEIQSLAHRGPGGFVVAGRGQHQPEEKKVLGPEALRWGLRWQPAKQR